jgi:hypothetical protein
MHKMDDEQMIVRRLLSGREVVIHPTACDGMYTCEEACDGVFYRIAKDGDNTTCVEKVGLVTITHPSACRLGCWLSDAVPLIMC